MKNKKAPPNCRIGDIYMVEFQGMESVQRGLRPALIFQNNVGNRHSPNVIVLPLTSQLKKLSMPTHVFISAAQGGLWKDSVVLCENPVCIPKNQLGAYVGTLTSEEMRSIAIASLLATGAVSFIDERSLARVRSHAISLNNV